MFLVTITQFKISRFLQSFNIHEFKVDSSQIITIVTDNFLSKLFLKLEGFSVIESPLISSLNFKDIIFSQITFNNHDNFLDIFKSTISGRPIYYHTNSNGDFFCSTHVSMLRKVGVPIEENEDVIPEFFVYRYIMPPRTLYRNINQLVAGSLLRIKLINGKCNIFKIDKYNPPIPEDNNSNKNIYDISNHTFILLNDSVKSLKPIKDRIMFLLSGGLDSSILFRICQNNFDIDLTFSTGYPFEHPRYNTEKEYALSAASSFQTKHTYYEIKTKDYLYGFLEAISMAEEPLHHLQSVLLYLLFKGGVPKCKDVVISGQGADGIFGLGLHNSLYRSEKMIFRRLSKDPILKLLEFASYLTVRGQARINVLNRKNSPISDPNNITWLLGAHGSEDWVSQYYRAKKQDIIKGRYDTIKSFENRSIYDVISILDFLGDVSITTSIWSKLGESQRKIAYYPFNDAKILNYIYSISWEAKLKNPKNILRCVARQLKIPKLIITRPKSAFGVNPQKWAIKGGVFEPLVPLASKVFDEKQIRSMQSIELKKAMTYWNILNYSIWKRLFINNEPLGLLLEELDEFR